MTPWHLYLSVGQAYRVHIGTVTQSATEDLKPADVADRIQYIAEDISSVLRYTTVPGQTVSVKVYAERFVKTDSGGKLEQFAESDFLFERTKETGLHFISKRSTWGSSHYKKED